MNKLNEFNISLARGLKLLQLIAYMRLYLPKVKYVRKNVYEPSMNFIIIIIIRQIPPTGFERSTFSHFNRDKLIIHTFTAPHAINVRSSHIQDLRHHFDKNKLARNFTAENCKIHIISNIEKLKMS